MIFLCSLALHVICRVECADRAPGLQPTPAPSKALQQCLADLTRDAQRNANNRWTLSIAPAQRETNFGTRLLAHSLAHARSNIYQPAIVESVSQKACCTARRMAGTDWLGGWVAGRLIRNDLIGHRRRSHVVCACVSLCCSLLTHFSLTGPT